MFKRLEDNLHRISEQIQYKLSNLLPNDISALEGQLFEAMRYSTLSQGKRLRPFLTVVTAELFGADVQHALQVASAIECIHSYSLIHDDLPALDNDDFRRGQESCHKKFGEAIAILAGDALLTYAFEILSDEATHPDPKIRLDLIKAISNAAGYSGMVGGQAIDIITEHSQIDYNEIVRLQRMKTGALFSISCEAGAILGHASKSMKAAVRAFAYNLGLAFQIIDDLLDAEGSYENSGKTAGKDAKAGKATLVSKIGLEKARSHAHILADQAIEHLQVFYGQAYLLEDLTKFVISKAN